MSVTELLRRIELFAGLTPEQVGRIAALGREAVYNAGDAIIHEGDPSDDLYIIRNGMVEVAVASGAIPDVPGEPQSSSLVSLGQGQVFGEMALVDQGARSATVCCVEDGTTLYVISCRSFWTLCEGDHHIGFVVMRNVAADLSFKLRHRNLQTRLEGAGGAA
jgi:CRP-like cAMP-binding protein